MKTFRNILLILGIAILTYSCCPKIITDSVDTNKTVETVTKVTPRPIEVVIPGRDINASFNIVECDPVTNKPIPATSTIKNGDTQITVKIDSTGMLDVLTSIDSLTKVVLAQDSLITTLEQENTTIKQTSVVKHVPRFYKICAWLAAAFVLLLGIKIYKLIAGFGIF